MYVVNRIQKRDSLFRQSVWAVVIAWATLTLVNCAPGKSANNTTATPPANPSATVTPGAYPQGQYPPAAVPPGGYPQGGYPPAFAAQQPGYVSPAPVTGPAYASGAGQLPAAIPPGGEAAMAGGVAVAPAEVNYRNILGPEMGTWKRLPDGNLYFKPYVGHIQGWAPYRNGYWSYVSQSGVTWVSYDPWGQITEHYGIWRRHVTYGWLWLPFSVRLGVTATNPYAPHGVMWFQQGGMVGWYPNMYSMYPRMYSNLSVFVDGFAFGVSIGMQPAYTTFVNGFSIVPANYVTATNMWTVFQQYNFAFPVGAQGIIRPCFEQGLVYRFPGGNHHHGNFFNLPQTQLHNRGFPGARGGGLRFQVPQHVNPFPTHNPTGTPPGGFPGAHNGGGMRPGRPAFPGAGGGGHGTGGGGMTGGHGLLPPGWGHAGGNRTFGHGPGHAGGLPPGVGSAGAHGSGGNGNGSGAGHWGNNLPPGLSAPTGGAGTSGSLHQIRTSSAPAAFPSASSAQSFVSSPLNRTAHGPRRPMFQRAESPVARAISAPSVSSPSAASTTAWPRQVLPPTSPLSPTPMGGGGVPGVGPGGRMRAH